MKTTEVIDARFKLAMLPAIVMGVLTNFYILVLAILLGGFSVLPSPIIGIAVFMICYFLLKSDKLTSKQAFLIAAYTVAVEIFVHTYYFGWHSGFYYFVFLLPVVFLLNSAWKLWIILVFNSSIILLTLALWYFFSGLDSFLSYSADTQTIIKLFNMACTACIVIVVMIYFSRTIYKKDRALVEANAELEKQNSEISAQHKNLQILIKEVHHRVKNNLQIISSLMSLQSRTVDNSKVTTVLNESRRRVEAIALIHQKLYQDSAPNQVDFNSYLIELMDNQQLMNPKVNCVVESDDVILNLDTAVPLGLIISEMVTNSIKHAFENIDDPELRVLLHEEDSGYELIVKDNGVGLSDTFNLQTPTSLGTEIIMALVDQIDAEIECSNDGGAKFRILFQDPGLEIIL